MNKKILIIDDAKDIADAFKKQLDLVGNYEVEIANGGKEGLQKIEMNTYDLVLLDLIMPDMDGIEILNILNKDRAKYQDIPVIALTNVTSPDIKKEVEDLGVAGFVIKTETDIDVVVEEFFNR